MTGTPDNGAQRPRRPRPDQPLRARWDPISDSGRSRSERVERRKRSTLGRFVNTYGWRAYAIPVLAVLTVVLLVMTVRNDGDTAVDKTAATGDDVRNTHVQDETTPIGAPTGQIQEAALPAGALPGGGPFTRKGDEVYRVVRGTGDKLGTAKQVYTYTVEAEKGLSPQDYGGDQAFAKLVDTTLANKKSWIGDGRVSFRRIDTGEPDLRISLTSTDTARELCGYQIKLETSCFYPPDKRVVINEARWVRGAQAFQGDDLTYRQYLINHETGHGIGYEKHQPCKENGALAPIMMQQTFGTANAQIMALDPDMEADRTLVCKPNAWPFPAN
ncbi:MULTISPECIES: DUF3152 domain-containing protein [Gordonia]|uniref:DUF3152 domain-containing protein n=1 Tax=Gordonia sihwensis NBRC 108236 TaxID=1223544 RepID=L7LJA5_9ACTN|nr:MULTISPECIES: DUF3152 domain-containing protein [Gordonia]AUH68257.1 DUF3152 domain-containing protein [Gordonia sp. YC-JH1]GAC60177.1 hypothetical protein GSI01S_08_00320 [Gordonia sihwensis NBRC 108236]